MSSDNDGCINVIVNVVIYGVIFLVSGFGTYIYNWKEIPPSLPKFTYENIDSIIYSDFNINTYKTKSTKLFDTNSAIAVLDFSSDYQSNAGLLSADMLATKLKNNGLNILERSEIEKLANEQQIEHLFSNIEQVKSLNSIDYLITGTVTLYKQSNQLIKLPRLVSKEEKEKYRNDYQKYFEQEKWFWNNDKEVINKLKEQNIFPLDDILLEYNKNPTSIAKRLFSVGLSIKVIDVATSEIVWSGQGETTDYTAVNAINRILEKIYKSLQN